jgi:hypothetical protein
LQRDPGHRNRAAVEIDRTSCCTSINVPKVLSVIVDDRVKRERREIRTEDP